MTMSTFEGPSGSPPEICCRHSASGGLLLMTKDHQQWYTFREETWNEYLDFAPIARQSLHDLLDPSG